ncbi:MAG: hypothetical protein ACYC3X_22880 [Pirellulaceae bacterium]
MGKSLRLTFYSVAARWNHRRWCGRLDTSTRIILLLNWGQAVGCGDDGKVQQILRGMKNVEQHAQDIGDAAKLAGGADRNQDAYAPHQ